MRFALVLLFLPWQIMLRGYVISKLWAWFIVPTFHQPNLRIPVALGISTLIGMFFVGVKQDDTNKEWYHPFMVGFLSSVLFLFFGWIYSLFL